MFPFSPFFGTGPPTATPDEQQDGQGCPVMKGLLRQICTCALQAEMPIERNRTQGPFALTQEENRGDKGRVTLPGTANSSTPKSCCSYSAREARVGLSYITAKDVLDNYSSVPRSVTSPL